MRDTLFKGLFRGKRIDNDEWVEGYLIQSTEIYGKPDPHTFIVNHEHPQSCFGSDIYIEVIPETVGYFIGRRDKNGKRMFEGDIIKSVIGNVIVIFKNCGFMGEVIGKQFYYDLYDDNLNSVEVIGNIYDNPELLEQEENK